MYAIIVYDVGLERINSVHNILKRYLNWIQNSVFEGELTPSKLEELRLDLLDVIDKEKDSIITYSLNDPKWMNKVIMGKNKGNTENIL